ncbi:hypothetical protein BGZ58_000768 [Dissophora ornata]|nr:hypothetical protein BGZ58_000768 [Dissophora ornata]
MQCQRFRFGKEIEVIAVRQDATGKYYSQMDDILDLFPDAMRFRVNDISILFLQDESGKRYEPKRIGHYPDDIVEVVAAPGKMPLTPSASSDSGLVSNKHIHGDSSMESQASTPVILSEETVVVSSLALSSPIPPSPIPPSPTLPPPIPSTPGPPSDFNIPMSTLTLEPDSPNDSTVQLLNTLPLTSPSQTTLHPMTMFDSLSIVSASTHEISSQIMRLQRQLAQSTDVQSDNHTQLMEQLLQMLKLQAEAKERDEKLQRLQQMANDRLAVLQQKIEAVLVQNYELHEYPIPRLFVVLPEKRRSVVDGSVATDKGEEGFLDTVKSWDPRNLVHEKFRLFFLCECGEHSRADSDIATLNSSVSLATTVQSEHRIHLANHEGYELTRPTQFFQQYGPYVLGMLLILRHCLTATSFMAPAVGQLQESLGKIADSIKSVTDNTMEAVNVSIDFLEQTMATDRAPAAAGLDAKAVDAEQDLFKHLDALEGADLRRLGTFLRNKDKDKVLGNLYRVTTTQGHVKWVCLEHYRASYREIAMKSFLQAVEVNHGVYDTHLRKVTITLASSTVAKDFFRQLGSQAPAVNELDVIFNWSFGSSDLSKMTDSLSSTNVRIVHIDLIDEEGSTRPDVKLLGKGKYHPVLELLANRKIQQLFLRGMEFFGSRTSNLPKSLSPSQLRSFHFRSPIRATDQSRLANILMHCPNLAELKLGAYNWSELHPELNLAFARLTRLQVLHLFKIRGEASATVKDLLLNVAAATEELRELVLFNLVSDDQSLQEALQAFSSTLEVLIVESNYPPQLDLVPILGHAPADHGTDPDLQEDQNSEKVESMALVKHEAVPGPPLKSSPFSHMTHLHLKATISTESVEHLSLFLPRLCLTHLSLVSGMKSLLRHVNYDNLRSIYVSGMSAPDLQPLWDVLPTSHIDYLSLASLTDIKKIPDYLKNVSLKRLWIAWMDDPLAGSDPVDFAPTQEFFGSVSQARIRGRSSFYDSSTVWLDSLLGELDLSRLEILALIKCGYNSSAETVLAEREASFSEQLTIHLEDQRPREMRSTKLAPRSSSRRIDHTNGGSMLPPGRVKTYSRIDYALLHHQLMSDFGETFIPA